MRFDQRRRTVGCEQSREHGAVHIVERVGIRVLDEAFLLALIRFKTPHASSKPKRMDKVSARFLVVEFHADARRLKARLGAQEADDRIAQPDQRRLAIGAHKRSQSQTKNHISAPAERHARIRLAAGAGGVVEPGGTLNQPGCFRIEHELPSRMMRKPRAQPLAMLLHKRESLSRRTFRRKQGLAQERAHGALTFIALLRIDGRCSAASRSRRRRQAFAGEADGRSSSSFVNISGLLIDVSSGSDPTAAASCAYRDRDFAIRSAQYAVRSDDLRQSFRSSAGPSRISNAPSIEAASTG